MSPAMNQPATAATGSRAVCTGCLAAGSSSRLARFTPTDSALIAAANNVEMLLCTRCRRTADVSQRFLENVRLVQALLGSVRTLAEEQIWDSLEKARAHVKTTCDLRPGPVYTFDLEADDMKEVACGDGRQDEILMKQETEAIDEPADDEDYGETVFEPIIIDVKKDEFDPELLGAIKQEVELGGNEDDCLPAAKSSRKAKRKGTSKTHRSARKTENGEKDMSAVEAVRLTEAELAAERDRQRREKPYASAAFRCEGCVKGFTYHETYERHMQRHTESPGRLPCGVCGRWVPAAQAEAHRGAHYRRYRCRACGLTRATRNTVAEHHAAVHARAAPLQCALCPKTYLKRALLRKHMAYRHRPKKRHQCLQCEKTFAVVECLREHVRVKHEGAPAGARLEHACDVCGRAFKSPSHLRAHAVAHTSARDYYCVECDRHFKSEPILKSHLRTAGAHVDGDSLPFGCDYCERRFMLKREVQRHIAKLHLNIKPYKCDQCDKAYTSTWSLREHRKLAHEGYKRPLRFPCTMCNKIFTRNVILQGHMRTHTGERPYQCPKCPATFNQSGVLHTHNRLVHLKLQRNGQPRPARYSVA